MDSVKKASVKLAFTFGICLFPIVENRIVFQTALPTKCLGHACGSAVVAGIAVASGMAGGTGGECGEGKDEEDVLHVSCSEWVDFRLVRCCVAVLTGLAGAWLLCPDLQLVR